MVEKTNYKIRRSETKRSRMRERKSEREREREISAFQQIVSQESNKSYNLLSLLVNIKYMF